MSNRTGQCFRNDHLQVDDICHLSTKGQKLSSQSCWNQLLLDCHYRCFIAQYDINNKIMTKQVTFPFDTTQVTPCHSKGQTH